MDSWNLDLLPLQKLADKYIPPDASTIGSVPPGGYIAEESPLTGASAAVGPFATFTLNSVPGAADKYPTAVALAPPGDDPPFVYQLAL